MHRPFTADWAAAFRTAIESDADYRSAAAKWTWPVAFVMPATPELGYGEATAVELQLDRGRCHDARLRNPDELSAPIVLSAPYAVWKSVVRGELDPIAGVVGGRIAVRGSIATLMFHAAAATALLACARRIATAFPDEP
ncbi:MAG: hypothetical protein KF709_06780 [Gemmatimonadaceae bacterium]|nr:hypothetical protein [Gemmatimonadaceae bacterium]